MPPPIILSPSAKTWSFQPPPNPETASTSLVPFFHCLLPHYNRTPLHSLPAIATELGLSAVLLKDESNRFGLPSFKILGASWAVYRALCSQLELEIFVAPPDADSCAGGPQLQPSLAEIRAAAVKKNVTIVTATEGNWGRAVGHMAGLFGVRAEIFVPGLMPETTRVKIRSEGAEVHVVDGTYEEAADAARKEAETSIDKILVLDVAEEGYEEIPQWVVEGYSTMLAEADAQVQSVAGRAATHAVVPVGAGSIAQAVTQHHKSADCAQRSTVIAVEADTAACLQTSIAVGAVTSVRTADTIMCGLNCGTLSTSAWEVLGKGVDGSATVTDEEAHNAVLELERQGLGLKVGPCGAATVAALRRACKEKREELHLGPDSVVILYCTEGRREYAIPGSVHERTE